MATYNLTRIKNNQITDSTILANTKIVPGSSVGSLFSPTLTMTSDVTITGNLTVQGASTYLTVASTNTYVNDPLIVLNNAFSGTNTYDLGFVFNRGTLLNQALIWNEGNKEFRLVGTTETGTTYGSINQSNFANLSVGNLTVQYAGSFKSISTTGALSGSSLNVSGNVDASTVLAQLVTSDDATFGNVAAGFIGNTGTAYSGASINLTGNVNAATVLAQLVTSDDATFGNISSGFIGNTGTAYSGASINLTGNVLAAAAVLNGLTVNGNETVTGYLNVASNVLASGAVLNALTVNGTGAFTTLTATGNVIGGLGQFAAINSTPIGNASASTGAFTTLSASAGFYANSTSTSTATTNGAVVVAGGLGVAGNVYAGALFSGNGLVSTGVFTGAYSDGVIVDYATGMGRISVGAVDGLTIYNGGLASVALVTIGSNGSLSAVSINNTPIGNATPNTGVFTTLTAGQVSSGFIGNTGTAFTGASLNVSANVVAAAGTYNALTVNGYTNINGNLSTAQLNAGQVNTTGNVLATGIVGSNLVINSGNVNAVGGYFVGNGAFLTGVIATNIPIPSYIQLNQSNVIVQSGGNILANVNGTVITAFNSSGIAVTGSVNASGNVLAVNGVYNQINVNTFLYAANIQAGAGGINSAGTIYGAGLNVVGNVEAQNGIFNALTVNGNESVTGYLNVTGNILSAGAVHSSLNVNGSANIANYLNVTGNVLASALVATTGAFSGNVIAGLAQFAAINATPIGNATPSTGVFTNVNSTGNVEAQNGVFNAVTVNGNVNVTGNILGLAGTLNTLVLNNTTNATGGSTGALQIAGGASISQDLWVLGNVYAGNIIGVSANIITVQDPLLYLRPNVTTPYNYDIGFYSAFTGVGLGTINQYQHTAVFRDPTNNTWTFASNLAEPSASYITLDSTSVYDPIKAGNLNLVNTTAATSTGTGALIVAGGAGIGGTVVAAQINSTGNVLGQAGTFNALTVNGNESVTGYLNVTGNVLASAISGASLNVSGNISTAQLNAGQINTTGNVLAQNGVFNAVTVNGNESVTGYLNVTGNVLGATATFSSATVNGALTATGLTTTAGINSSANVLATGGVFNALTVNGNESVTGYLNVTGNVLASAIIGASLNVSGNVLGAAATFNSLQINGNESVTGYLNVTGNILGATASFGAINSTGYINTSGNISTPQLNAGQINTSGNILSAGAVLNALTVNGNESVTGYLAVTGNVIAGLAQFASINATPIGNATPSTGVFTTLTAGQVSSGFIGNTGTAFTGASINVTGNVLSTGAVHNALTVNGTAAATTFTATGNIIAGLAQFASINATPIGNATASSGAFTSLSATGTVYANATTASTTATNGALVVAGALGLSGNLVLSGSSNIIAGGTAGTNGQYLVATGTGVQWQTLSVAAGAYITLGGSNVTVTQNYVNVAINSSNVGTFTNTGLNNTAVGATTASTGKFTTLQATSTVTLNNYTGYVKANGGSSITAASTIPNTDITGLGTMSTQDASSVTITGGTIDGASIGYTNAPGAILSSLQVQNDSTFNTAQSTSAFQVKGRYATTLIYTTGGNTVVIGGSNTAVQVGATLKVNGTDSLLLPVGSTAQRPSNLPGGSDVAGMIRYNSSITNVEYYNGTSWTTPGSVTTLIVDNQFNGDGSANVFTLSNAATTSSAMVSVNGILQIPTTAYSVTGTTLTFTESPAVGDAIDVRIIAATQTVTSLASGNGYNVFDVSDANSLYANIATGTASATPRISINTAGTINLVNGAKIAVQNPAINIVANATPYVLDSFIQSLYNSARYEISSENPGLNAFETYSVTLLTDGAGNAYLSTYGIVNNGNPLGGFTANVLGGNVQLYYTSNTNGKGINANVRVYTTYIA